MGKSQLKTIWEKTDGHCHFCGEKLKFNAYGKNKYVRRNWNIDHIYQKARGGKNSLENYLPICGICNGLRWHRPGKSIQNLFRYGIIANREVKRKNSVGTRLQELYKVQQQINKKRREKERGKAHC